MNPRSRKQTSSFVVCRRILFLTKFLVDKKGGCIFIMPPRSKNHDYLPAVPKLNSAVMSVWARTVLNTRTSSIEAVAIGNELPLTGAVVKPMSVAATLPQTAWQGTLIFIAGVVPRLV